MHCLPQGHANVESSEDGKQFDYRAGWSEKVTCPSRVTVHRKLAPPAVTVRVPSLCQDCSINWPSSVRYATFSSGLLKSLHRPSRQI